MYRRHGSRRKRRRAAVWVLSHAGRADNEKLFAKWSLPEPGSYANPAPAYRELLAERALV